MAEPYTPPTLPLKSLDWGALVPAISRANRAVARYDALLLGMPNPDLLITPLKRQEAVLSSRIEGTQASAEDTWEQEAHPKRATEHYDDIQEVHNYQRALDEAFARMEERPLSLNLIRDMHRTLLDGARGKFRSPGEFRQKQVWIGGDGSTLETASYVPPAPQDVLPLLDNWERYIHTQERDELVQAAIMHGQFEKIHPFLDGNGRVGRILIPLFLYEKGVLSRPVLYVSAYFEHHRRAYYEHLGAISEGKWEEWIAFFLAALEAQANENARQIQDVRALYDELKGLVVQHTRSPYAVPILDYVFSRPIFSVPQMAQDLDANPKVLSRVVKSLVEIDVVRVREAARGAQSATYDCAPLLAIVEESA